MKEASEMEADKKKESYKRLYLSHRMYKKIQDIIVDLDNNINETQKHMDNL